MKESLCEYCNEAVPHPYPIHPACAQVWLKGYHTAKDNQKDRPKFAKSCCGQQVEIYQFIDYIEFKCGDRCRSLYVYGYELPQAYLFWNLMVENDLKTIIKVSKEI